MKMIALHSTVCLTPLHDAGQGKALTLAGRARAHEGQGRSLTVRYCVPPTSQETATSSSSSEEQDSGSVSASSASPDSPRKAYSSVEATDWIASSLTRRFGLGAGLAWVAFLAFGVISEQIKTRREVYLEEQGTRDVDDSKEVVLESNVRYVDLRVGGGALPLDGDLVLVDLVGKVVDGETFVDTESGPKKRPIALVFGRRPYVGGMCAGLEEAMKSMHVGGKRQVVVPPDMGFGASGTDLGDSNVIPPNATLEYTVTLLKSSIAPS
ncbi:hypothetical protein KP509_03G058700 [Ceratopteris richardii]|uniref:peptidylprolyl isomerase n=1 Tax=Ceratopteris richardii TaxID=49495 RepID=A0A8T2V7Q5_CERRI|nr:hypothetical protein KP509_03G058700 [Ceratopteris richardii]